jgi:hypothetical protein
MRGLGRALMVGAYGPSGATTYEQVQQARMGVMQSNYDLQERENMINYQNNSAAQNGSVLADLAHMPGSAASPAAAAAGVSGKSVPETSMPPSAGEATETAPHAPAQAHPAATGNMPIIPPTSAASSAPSAAAAPQPTPHPAAAQQAPSQTSQGYDPFAAGTVAARRLFDDLSRYDAVDQATMRQGFAQMTMSSNPQAQAAGRAAIGEVQQRRASMAQAAINGQISDVALQKAGFQQVASPIPGIMDYRTGQFYPNYQLATGHGPRIGGAAPQPQASPFAAPPQGAPNAAPPSGGGIAPPQPPVPQIVQAPAQAPPSGPIKAPNAEPQKKQPGAAQQPAEDPIARIKRENPMPDFLHAPIGSPTMPVMGQVGNRDKEAEAASNALASLKETKNELYVANRAFLQTLQASKRGGINLTEPGPYAAARWNMAAAADTLLRTLGASDDGTLRGLMNQLADPKAIGSEEQMRTMTDRLVRNAFQSAKSSTGGEGGALSRSAQVFRIVYDAMPGPEHTPLGNARILNALMAANTYATEYFEAKSEWVQNNPGVLAGFDQWWDNGQDAPLRKVLTAQATSDMNLLQSQQPAKQP